jgi:hypothetical protein
MNRFQQIAGVGLDRAVWSTYWRTVDQSRIFRPDTPYWSPGEHGYSSGGIGPGG